jgi:glycerol-3-phosphate dehydrogenase subunit B
VTAVGTRALRVLEYDVVVIGSGLAGLVAAASAAAAGARVGVVAESFGGLAMWSGLVSGEAPAGEDELDAVRFFIEFGASCGLEYGGRGGGREADGEAARKGVEVLSASGRPVRCLLAPETAWAGDLRDLASSGTETEDEGLLVVGFTELEDYPAAVIAGQAAAETGVRTAHRTLSLGRAAGRGLGARIAGLFDDPAWFEGFLETSCRLLGREARRFRGVALPPVLGLLGFRSNLEALRQSLGTAVFELPAVPPSLPGMRFWRLWRWRLEADGRTSFHLGRRVVEADTDGDRCLAVSDGLTAYRAAAFILATGGVAGRGLEVPPKAFFEMSESTETPRSGQAPGGGSDRRVEGGVPVEPIFGLETSGRRTDWLSWGVRVKDSSRPCPAGGPANVFVAGWQLGGPEPDALLSITSGWRAGRAAAGCREGGAP